MLLYFLPSLANRHAKAPQLLPSPCQLWRLGHTQSLQHAQVRCQLINAETIRSQIPESRVTLSFLPPTLATLPLQQAAVGDSPAFVSLSKVSKFSQPVKRQLLWGGALAVSLTAHYYVLRTSAGDEVKFSAKLTSSESAITWPLSVRVLENSPAQSYPQSTQVVVDLSANEQPSSLPRPSIEQTDSFDSQSSRAKENLRRSIEDLKGFYTFEEVDKPAAPSEDWEIPIQAINAMGVKFLVIRVWIENDGAVRHIKVISSTPQTLVIHDQETITRALSLTKMTPAIKGGRSVPSQRTIEMAIEL
jgi:hypothetical protein